MPRWADIVLRGALVCLLVLALVVLGLLSASDGPEPSGGDPPACAETLAGCAHR